MSEVNAYNCVVRPSGQITHEVPKLGVCAKEIVLLRMIHGADAIHKIEHVGQFEEYNQDGVLLNLANTYGKQLVEKVFNTVLFDFQDDDETGKKYISLKVIESEAKAADTREILREAGPVNQIRMPERDNLHVSGEPLSENATFE